MSAPAFLAATEVGDTMAPVIAQTSTGLAAAWREVLDAGSVVYSECVSPSSGGSCVQASSWTTLPLFSAAGPAVALAVKGTTRALAFKGFGAVYAECTGNCTAATSWTSTITGPAYANAQGADLALEDLGSGVLRRTAVWGGDSPLNPSSMLYRECAGACTSPQPTGSRRRTTPPSRTAVRCVSSDAFLTPTSTTAPTDAINGLSFTGAAS